MQATRNSMVLLLEFERWVAALPTSASPRKLLHAAAENAVPTASARVDKRQPLARLFRLVANLVALKSAPENAGGIVHLLAGARHAEHLRKMFLNWCRINDVAPHTIGECLTSGNPVLFERGRRQLIALHQSMAKKSKWKAKSGSIRAPWAEALARMPVVSDAAPWESLAADLLSGATLLHKWSTLASNRALSRLPLSIQIAMMAHSGADPSVSNLPSASFIAFFLDALSEWEFVAPRSQPTRDHEFEREPAYAGPATLVISIRRWSKTKPPKVVRATVGERIVSITPTQASTLLQLGSSPDRQHEVDYRTITYRYNKGSNRKSLIDRVPELAQHLEVKTIPGKTNKRLVRAKLLHVAEEGGSSPRE